MASAKRNHAVRVIVRPRPTGDETTSNWEQGTTSFVDDVLAPQATQDDTFERIAAPLLEGFKKDGQSCIVFAYGQTGSGKTHTILGPPGSLTLSELAMVTAAPDGRTFRTSTPSWGLFPRVASEMLSWGRTNAKLKIGAVELYLDRAYDLLRDRSLIPIGRLQTKSSSGRLFDKLASREKCFDENGKWKPPLVAIGAATDRENQKRAGLQENVDQTLTLVSSVEDIASTARLIDTVRSSRSHSLNDRSSRSHCFILVQYSWHEGNSIKTASFAFVDLAGSERVDKSGVVADSTGGALRFHIRGNSVVDIPGTRLDEARNVNASLSALGRVLLTMACEESFIPYRDSALTTLLQPWLEQQAKADQRMVVVLTVRTDANNLGETQSTFRFGKVVARIRGERGRSQQQGCQIRRSKSLSCRPEMTDPDSGPRVELIGDRRVRLMKEILSLEAKLGEMTNRGAAGGVNMDVPAPTRQGFFHNQRFLEEAKADALNAKIRLAELKAAHSHATADEVNTAAMSVKDAESRVAIYFGLVARQISAGVWQPPSEAFAALQQRMVGLRQELADLG